MGGKGERKPWGTTEPKVNVSSPFECNLNSRMDLVPVPAAVFLRPQGEGWRYSRFLEGIQIRCWIGGPLSYRLRASEICRVGSPAAGHLRQTPLGESAIEDGVLQWEQ